MRPSAIALLFILPPTTPTTARARDDLLSGRVVPRAPHGGAEVAATSGVGSATLPGRRASARQGRRTSRAPTVTSVRRHPGGPRSLRYTCAQGFHARQPGRAL